MREGRLVGAQGEISREGSGKMTHIEMFPADCQSEEGEFLGAIKRAKHRSQLARRAQDAEGGEEAARLLGEMAFCCF